MLWQAAFITQHCRDINTGAHIKNTHTQRHSHTFKFVAHGNTFTSAKANAVADTVGVANLKNYILFMIISKNEMIPITK